MLPLIATRRLTVGGKGGTHHNGGRAQVPAKHAGVGVKRSIACVMPIPQRHTRPVLGEESKPKRVRFDPSGALGAGNPSQASGGGAQSTANPMFGTGGAPLEGQTPTPLVTNASNNFPTSDQAPMDLNSTHKWFATSTSCCTEQIRAVASPGVSPGTTTNRSFSPTLNAPPRSNGRCIEQIRAGTVVEGQDELEEGGHTTTTTRSCSPTRNASPRSNGRSTY